MDNEVKKSFNEVDDKISELSGRMAEIYGQVQTFIEIIEPIMDKKIILNKTQFNILKDCLNLLDREKDNDEEIARRMLKILITEIEQDIKESKLK